MKFRGIELSAVIFTGLLFLVMFVTGTLLSLGKAANEVVQVLHEVVAVLTFISTSGVIYSRRVAGGRKNSPHEWHEPEAGVEAVFGIAG